ncbi:glycosyltransferase family 2 protein [Promicromonospora iranensis]|uniref:Glycosyltransferase involved in cell wall biosynthesis n=1 Tax=Promicromonospora iranensis TaxID=1105144 RepID=A0ABU2CME6_9MICO|nr:glycosyltransferase [Promicromonospora iranensis]MDR7382456.1 glycosyltransferase involved in cell wall biosynthesis [Promicromonospora iranensis]
MRTPSVTVAVVTYRRTAMLSELLPLVTTQAADLPGASVLVVDNDPDGSAAVVCSGHDVRYVAEPRPGIGAARDRAVREAGTDAVAFIDDDELPQDDWLSALVTTWRESGAAAVAGPVLAVLPGPPDPWITAGAFYPRPNPPSGTRLGAAGAGNLLLDLGWLRAAGISFDPDRGDRGGEDTQLTRRLVRSGGEIVWCADAVVSETMPAERYTRRWLLQRRFGHGVVSGELAVELAGGFAARQVARTRELLAGGCQVVGGATRAALGLGTGSARHHARGLRTVMRGAGRVVGALGGAFAAYRRG